MIRFSEKYLNSNLFKKKYEALDILSINAFNFEIRAYSSFMCKLHTFATYTVAHMSSILLMSVSVNRAYRMAKMRIFKNDSLKRLKKCEAMKLIKCLNSKKRQAKLVKVNARSAFKIEFQKLYHRTAKKIQAKSRKKTLKKGFYEKMSVNTQFALILLLIALINFHYILFIDLVEILKANVLNFFHLFVKNNSKIYSFDESNTEIEKLIDFSSINAKRVCYAQHETIYEFFLERIWFWIDLSIYSLIPFAVMSISSFIIVVKFRKMNRSYFEFISKPTRQYNKRIY
jgi:hypothetical protein